MKWLVVVKERNERPGILNHLWSLGCKILNTIGEDTLSVEGPADLVKQLQGMAEVYPNSTQEAM